MMIKIVDGFMVVGELLCVFCACHLNSYSVKAQGFLISASLILAGLYLTSLFVGMNDFISDLILVLSVAVVIITNWHDFRQMRKIRQHIKIMRMTPLQKQKYDQAKEAKQEKKARRKANPKQSGVPGMN